MSKVHLQQVSKVQAIIAGLKANIDLVKDKGIDDQFIQKLEKENNHAAECNEECENLKNDVKVKVRRTNMQFDEVKRMTLHAKKIVKLNYDKEKWKDFGISDLR